jgi:hypothetical protein
MITTKATFNTNDKKGNVQAGVSWSRPDAVNSERLYLLISTESQDASRNVIESPPGLTVPSSNVDR